MINNKTLSIYMDGKDFNTIYRSYNLDSLSVHKNDTLPKCIDLKESHRSDQICIVNENIKDSIQ